MDALHKYILSQFRLDSPAVTCQRYGCGHINVTYLVVTASGRRYILQKISNRAFPRVSELQENIAAVTAFLHSRNPDPYSTLTLIETLDGKTWCHHEQYGDWRIYDFIENSICLQAPESPQDFYQSAIAFGTFQQQLRDFPAASLHETIRNFHNTPDRYRIFRKAVAEDAVGRAKDVQQEIDFAFDHEKVGGTLIQMLHSGELPLRVTHNDTKLNNVMLSSQTRTPLCVIDLDTTMPGLSAYDFGDSIRFGAATAAEDEKDLAKMQLSVELFRTFTRGFLTACPGLTQRERDVLPLGALIMTLECGVRFLTDYLEGDHYFSIRYPEHNLDRCRTQFRLVADIESKLEVLGAIVKEEYEKI